MNNINGNEIENFTVATCLFFLHIQQLITSIDEYFKHSYTFIWYPSALLAFLTIRLTKALDHLWNIHHWYVWTIGKLASVHFSAEFWAHYNFSFDTLLNSWGYIISSFAIFLYGIYHSKFLYKSFNFYPNRHYLILQMTFKKRSIK